MINALMILRCLSWDSSCFMCPFQVSTVALVTPGPVYSERKQVPEESDLNYLFWMSAWPESRSLFQWLHWADFLTGPAQVEIDFQWEGIRWIHCLQLQPVAWNSSSLRAHSHLYSSVLPPPFPVTHHSSGLPICHIQIHPWYSQTNVRVVMCNYFVKGVAQEIKLSTAWVLSQPHLGPLG